MSSYEINEYKNAKKKMRILGMIFIGVGLLIGIIGGISIMIGFTSLSNFGHSSGEEGFTGIDELGSFTIGGFALVIGFGLVGFGLQLFLTSHARTISRYSAIESAPATEIMSEAFASGMSKGFKKSEMSDFSNEKEIIKIRCRKCGYLETEDATFCSKCGNEI